MIPGMAADTLVYLNGAYLPVGEAKISVLDRGFIFGDGIYEVVPAYQGRPFRMDEHLARLARSLAAIRLELPMGMAGVRRIAETLIARQAAENCIVYFQVTRGVARRDHPFPVPAPEPTVFAMATAFRRPDAAARERGLSVISITDERWLHCDIKSISLLGNVLAKQAAVEAGVDEVLQFRDGLLTEGSSCNAWVVQGGKLLAPPLGPKILEGIRYGLMLELAREAGIEFQARDITRADVETADELLLTSASKEVLPVLRRDGAAVGAGVPGPVFRRLAQAYDSRIEALMAQPPVTAA
ncbi:D-amino acid aminotransferase [Kerstersia gyiorum]|jgi:D-alanine transaminase|uniref:D-amino acid aminotransferase n=1 Tax=Kerstersia gyiorum TaxID=206506 RepID=UPI0024301092|nr:D-amino acid aminotransferase [Kerstersia gyiorum]MCH4270508.1 D-amino acid aminotransferase [Kerstersia gyiorum]MCI1228555.1 D-amino acid aminotransferase [Kerstersia gyiorum]